MPIRVDPSPVTYPYGRTTTTKTRMMPRPPDSSYTGSYRRRVTPQATHHGISSTSSAYTSKPSSYTSSYSGGIGSTYSTTNRDAYRARPPEVPRRTTGPIMAKYEPKNYSDDKYSSSYDRGKNSLSGRRSTSLSSLSREFLRLPYVDDSPTRTTSYKSSNFGSVTDTLYKSSIDDLSARRPRDSSVSRTSSANSTSEVKDKYGVTSERTTYRSMNRQSSQSTLKRTPSLVKTRRSSLNEFSARSTGGEYGLSTVKGAGKRGLKNIGNTCYMNTIVQCLSSVPELTCYCKRIDDLSHRDVNSKSYHSGKLFQEFADTVKKLWESDSSNGTSYTPYNLKRQIGNMLSHEFRGWRQHDAAEFLLGLLAELSEDVNKVRDPPRLGAIPEDLKPAALARLMWQRQEKLTQSIIFDLFNGLTRSTLRCSTCDYVSVTFELFYDLSVPIPPSSSRSTLADALELYTKPETLTGDNKFRCEKCKALREGTKKMEIEICPSVLILQLKRFSSSHSGLTRKVDTHIDFPITGMDLSNYLSQDASCPSSRYQLQAVCNHYGGTAGGHYIAYCRHQEDNQWYKYDDERVTSLNECNVVTSNAYVLFYMLKSKLTRSDSRL